MEENLNWLVRELHALAGELAGEQAPAPVLLAIDQGGHASRVIAFDTRGMHLAESFTPISTFRSGNDRVEHDPRELTESIRTALDDIAETLGSDASRVAAVGLATQRSSIVCWDRRSGKALSPVLSWQDRRNAPLVERLASHKEAIRERTGLVLSPHYGASKLRWCLDELPAVRKAREDRRLALGPLASYLLYSLLEERPYCVDPANASRTQLWDPQTRNWAPQLGEWFGVALELLPACVHTRHSYGHLEFAGRCVPLIVCTGDQSAAPFASGAIDSDTIYLNVGTGAFLQQSGGCGDPRLLRSVAYSDEERTIAMQEATINGAAAALDWLNERVGIDTHRAALALARAKAARSVPLFVNAVGGIAAPYWRADIEPRFVGEGTEAQQVQAVVESIAFLICANIELMRAGTSPHRVLATGGLSSSDYLCECIASLSGLPVERSSLKEATALGIAYLVVGHGAEWRPPVTFETFPPAADASLAERYRRWREAMDAAVGAGA